MPSSSVKSGFLSGKPSFLPTSSVATVTFSLRVLVLLIAATTPSTHGPRGVGQAYSTSHSNSSAPDGTFFQLSTGLAEYDHAYEVALRELGANRDLSEGVYVAGSGWGQLWTRDSAYAIELAAGLIDPTFSAKTLLKCAKPSSVPASKKRNNRGNASQLLANVSLDAFVEEVATARAPFAWLQDKCGHFGGWPVLSDAIVGAQGAWSLYLVQGDLDFLKKAYAFTLASLQRAEEGVYDSAKTGLFTGCSSFMESNGGYPQRFAWDGSKVGETKALSTNLLHYNGYILGSKMAHELGKDEASNILHDKAMALRDNIRNQMWLESDGSTGGYYSYVMDENNELLPQMEGLGESFVLLAPEFEDDETRIDSMFANIERTPNGIACLWPQFEHNWTLPRDTNPLDLVFNTYHNGRIWPFVQGYWAMAAAKHGRVDIFTEELKNLLKLSQATTARIKTNLKKSLDGKEFVMPENVTSTFAEFYELDGTFHWSQRSQLWSDAGFLSMFFYGVFGLRLETTGIRWKPMKPLEVFAKDKPISLRGIHYRQMTLDVTLHGAGTRVASASLDGSPLETASMPPFLEAGLKGHHVLEIHLEEKEGSGSGGGETAGAGSSTEAQADIALILFESTTAGAETATTYASNFVDQAFEEYQRLMEVDVNKSGNDSFHVYYIALPLMAWGVLMLLLCRFCAIRRTRY